MTNVNETNKVAIVTGSSRDIGASIAKRLASDGFKIIDNYVGREADANRVVEEIEDQGGSAAAIQAHVSDPVQVSAMFDRTINLIGGVDILVNNAGILQPGLTLLADTDDDLLKPDAPVFHRILDRGFAIGLTEYCLMVNDFT